MSDRRVLIGLIGANIMGSLSPALFADAFAAAGIDGYYHLMDVDRSRARRLPQLLAAIKTAGFAGTNVTFPFKQEVMPLLDAVDPEAAQIGAVNTVAIAPDGRTTGYNFDRRGWRHSFEETFGRTAAQGATVVLVGAGGAGHAVAFALMDLGVGLLVIHDRDAARAKALVAGLAKDYGAARCRVANALADDIAAADGVVNATQVGMRGFPGNPVPVSALRAETLGRRRHLHADRDRFHQGRRRQRRPRHDRRRHVRAPGGRSVPAVRRDRAGYRAPASHLCGGAGQARCADDRNDVNGVGTAEDNTMKTSIATVCLSGGLSEKLQAIAAAGFRGVEIFESDLLSFNGTPADVAKDDGRSRPQGRHVPAVPRFRGHAGAAARAHLRPRRAQVRPDAGDSAAIC